MIDSRPHLDPQPPVDLDCLRAPAELVLQPLEQSQGPLWRGDDVEWRGYGARLAKETHPEPRSRELPFRVDVILQTQFDDRGPSG